MAKSYIPSTTALLAALALLGSAVLPAHAAPKKKTPSKTPPKSKTAIVKKPEPPPPPPLAPGELPLAARAAISMDIKTGAVLYEKNPDAMEYPASATKILTALLVLEAGDLEKELTVQIEDTKVEPSSLEIKPGETYKRKDLLYALLLKSANDVAMALGRDNAGSVAAFADKMTAKAAALGATSSHFTNPHGLHNPHHFTTARDMAIIARAAMQNPLFREIVATPEAFIPKAGVPTKLRNHNKLLAMLAGCNGVKTGYTGPAQQVLVSSAMREGKEVLSVVLHTNKPGIWEDSKMLLNDGFVKLGLGAPVVPAAQGTPGIPAPPAPPAPAPTPASTIQPAPSSPPPTPAEAARPTPPLSAPSQAPASSIIPAGK